jgi:Flp pilus assembly protein TadG
VPIFSTMMSRSRLSPRRRARGDHGAVVVEAAIVGILFFTVLLGVVEFGLAFFDYLTTSNMSRVGARTGSTMGKDTSADYQILQQISQATSSMPLSNIQAIVVYKATGIGAAPTTGCLTASSSTDKCNFYTTASFSTPSSQFDCGTSAPDRFWCPSSRLVGASAPATGTVTGPPDYIGVYIKVVHPNVTGLFGSSYTYTDSTVIRIEAQTP